MLTHFEIPKLHAVFAFFLLISANHLTRLYPCRIQKMFNNSIMIKHILGFLTLAFFVILVDKDNPKDLQTIIGMSLMLYGIVIILMNTHSIFFLLSIIILGFLYILNIDEKGAKAIHLEEIKYNINNPNLHNFVYNTLYILFFISTTVGFLIYMGEKKLEFKDKFDYLKFLFGTPTCQDNAIKSDMYKSMLAAFK